MQVDDVVCDTVCNTQWLLDKTQTLSNNCNFELPASVARIFTGRTRRTTT